MSSERAIITICEVVILVIACVFAYNTGKAKVRVDKIYCVRLETYRGDYESCAPSQEQAEINTFKLYATDEHASGR